MKGFNAGMDEPCSSVPAQVRHGTLKDANAHKENRRRLWNNTLSGEWHSCGNLALSAWVSLSALIKGEFRQTTNQPSR